MTKHRTITSFVAVALLAVAATAAALRPLPSKNHPDASAGLMSMSELTVDVNKLRRTITTTNRLFIRRSAISRIAA
jgi:hypothetical protein